MSTLSQDIIFEILSRLAVKPLLRFRCVSKPWCSLIDNPDFIKLHLSHSLKTHTHLSLILRGINLYSIDFDSLKSTLKLNHPFEDGDGGTEVFDSCNGLLAFSNSREDLGLWNPSTRKFLEIPVSEIEFPDEYGIDTMVIYGFGYDPISDDYKLVRIEEFLQDDDDDCVYSEFKVYSLKKNSWRRIKNFLYYLLEKGACGVLANNALHWVASKPRPDKSLIVAFDLGTEEYRGVPLLELWYDEFFYITVGALGGCLCMVANYENYRVDIWVMKEYGVEGSWTKLLSVEESEGNHSFDFVRLKPLLYSKSGDRVLVDQDGEKFMWYDLTTKGSDVLGLRVFRRHSK